MDSAVPSYIIQEIKVDSTISKIEALLKELEVIDRKYLVTVEQAITYVRRL